MGPPLQKNEYSSKIATDGLRERCAMRTLHIFFQEGVWGNLAFSKKAGFPQVNLSLKLRQAVGQGLGVGEEGLDREVSQSRAPGDAFGLVPGDEV